MWTHAAWQGKEVGAGERLRWYAERCDAVEGNTTFYATPARRTVETWAAQTDPDFRFVVKLPKTITHERRLKDTDADLREFLHAMEPLGPRIHTLWAQLPGSFGPNDLGALALFLRGLPGEYRYCVEVRHRAFFDDDRAGATLESLLGRIGAEWTIFDTTVLFDGAPVTAAEQEAWSKKPRVPRRTRALTEHPMVRYHGRDDPERTVAGWRPWLDTVAGWLREGRSPTVFVHTPDNASALDLARRFHAEVRARVPELDPLPEPVERDPMTLF
ncbi:DUF72 domain-containing protein [Nocardia puris]|nr:DUF72 domain-containing protein [Nocardia puris]MBF6214091.1 DUF72 domain-containing protein [Nocardia puris]MBF6461527.1 DUF72 domain-containing protein [Nocardia puris]